MGRRCHILGVEDVLRTFNAKILTSSRPNLKSKQRHFLRPNDQSFDVQMAKVLTSKWPKFWRANDQTSYLFILPVSTEHWTEPNLFYMYCYPLTLPPPLVLHLHCTTTPGVVCLKNCLGMFYYWTLDVSAPGVGIFRDLSNPSPKVDIHQPTHPLLGHRSSAEDGLFLCKIINSTFYYLN